MYLADFAGKKAISYLLYSRDLFLLVYLSFRTALFHQLQGQFQELDALILFAQQTYLNAPINEANERL